MRKMYLLTIMLMTYAASFSGIYAQQETPDGKVEVIAVKGKVVFDGSTLMKGDTIQFNSETKVMDQFVFSSTSDWIKVMEINSRKVYHFYKQKKYACGNCLFTRGLEPDNEAMVYLLRYFSLKPVFLFENDTIIYSRQKNLNDINSIAVFKIAINGKIYYRKAGNYDTIILSRDRLFGFVNEGEISWPSFQADSIRLFYYDKVTHKETIPELPAFQVMFVEDVVGFFLNMGMNSEEIYYELMENYIAMRYLVPEKGRGNTELAKEWVKAYIDTLVSRSVK